jgi:hypothetical protein
VMELNVCLQHHWRGGEMSSVGTCENRTPDDGIERISPGTLGVECNQSVHANTEGPTMELNVCLQQHWGETSSSWYM